MSSKSWERCERCGFQSRSAFNVSLPDKGIVPEKLKKMVNQMIYDHKRYYDTSSWKQFKHIFTLLERSCQSSPDSRPAFYYTVQVIYQSNTVVHQISYTLVSPKQEEDIREIRAQFL